MLGHVGLIWGRCKFADFGRCNGAAGCWLATVQPDVCVPNNSFLCGRAPSAAPRPAQGAHLGAGAGLAQRRGGAAGQDGQDAAHAAAPPGPVSAALLCCVVAVANRLMGRSCLDAGVRLHLTRSMLPLCCSHQSSAGCRRCGCMPTVPPIWCTCWWSDRGGWQEQTGCSPGISLPCCTHLLCLSG